MTPGPNLILACPHCGGLHQLGTYRSRMCFGKQLWTDGHGTGDEAPGDWGVAECKRCGRCYWLAEASEVGCYEFWRRPSPTVDPAWLEAPHIQEPDDEAYYRAIDGGMAATPRQRFNLRLQAWWRRNDAYRHPEPPAADAARDAIASASDACKRNMEALASELTDWDPSDRVLNAELHRELGEFAKAKAILVRFRGRSYSAIVPELLALCELEDTCVRPFRFGR